MTDIEQLLQQIRNFHDARDWQQFHNSKDLAVALSIEASELLELFLWKGNEGADPQKLKEELADVLMYVLLLADKHGLDIKQPELRQILKNLCSLSAENEIVEFKEAKNLMNSTGVVDSGM
ncbi:nucleotide pyrophosphohydrolase [Sphingobacterium sp. DN00404]|uniref:Nucleotide pyrophosphohydrolase n=2 Tax=Sphingobacterium micropteri TaxID=2763501 RepID=A0ABR7YUF1_9SPHI|nr:nucleotide pyrophosphohydrolase [Sphingobacterium micropteri]